MQVGIKVRSIGVLKQQATWADGCVPPPELMGDGGSKEMEKTTDHLAKTWKCGIDHAHEAGLPVRLAHIKGLEKGSVGRTPICVRLPPDTNCLIDRRDVSASQVEVCGLAAS